MGLPREARLITAESNGTDVAVQQPLLGSTTWSIAFTIPMPGKFKPEHLGQLNFYISAVNDLVKFPGMAPTVGILVCGSKHEPTVRYG